METPPWRHSRTDPQGWSPRVRRKRREHRTARSPGPPFPTGGDAVVEVEVSELTAVHLPTGLKLRALRLEQGCENVKGRIAPHSTKLSLKLTQLYYLLRGPPRRLPLTLRSPQSPIQQNQRSLCHRANLQQYRLDPLLQGVNSFSVFFCSAASVVLTGM